MEEIIIQKECTSCKDEKTLDNFHKKPRGKHGVESRCKSCKNEKNKLAVRACRDRKKSVTTPEEKRTKTTRENETPCVTTQVIPSKPTILISGVTSPSTNDRFERLKRLK